jgi:hypothetical protein
MRVMCVQDFGRHKVGDIAVVPDGSEVAPGWYRPLTDDENAAIDGPPEMEKGSGSDDGESGDDVTTGEEAGTAKRKGKG